MFLILFDTFYILKTDVFIHECFDVTKERKPRSCSTGFSSCVTVKKRSLSINY